MTAAPTRRAVVIFVGLQLGQVMSTLDGTIVATALPSIVRDVGGVTHVTWVVTAYVLAMVASMPLYGKVGDLYGRKRVLIVALVVFLAGSVACGVAQSMPQLLASRFVQGLGGGGLATLAMAALADVVPARQLGRWMGYQGVIFVVASVTGPVVGGLFVDHLSWRWAFLINVPLGLVAIGIVTVMLRVPTRRVAHALDWLGSALLVGALVCLVLVATLGGHELAWASAGIGLLAIGVVAFGALFLRHERHAVEPVVPLTLFSDPVIRVSAGINFTSGLLLWCGLFFVPLFVQEVSGLSPTSSGLALMPLMFGAAFGTLVSGRWVERTGRLRIWPIAGAVCSAVGVGLLATLPRGAPLPLVGAYVLLLGTGVGFAMQTSLLAVQNSADPGQLGAATSTALLCRTLGNTVGTPILGGILNAGLASRARDSAAYAHALPPVFLAGLGVALVSLWVAWRLPERPLREHAHLDRAEMSGASG